MRRITNILFLLLFVSFFVYYYPFRFGINTDNVEELPLIYHSVGLANYFNDQFVSDQISNYNQVTPYIFFISLLIKIFGINNIQLVFMIFHMFIFISIYFVLCKLVKYLSSSSELFCFLPIILLLVLDHDHHIIPAGREIFLHFLDETSIALMFSLWAIYFLVKRKYINSVIFLLFTNITHALYGVPLFIIIVFSLFFDFIINNKFNVWKNIKSLLIITCGYILSTIPYGLILFFSNHDISKDRIDISLVHEIIRAPHHLVMPTLNNPLLYDQEYRHFFIFCMLYILFQLSLFILNKKRIINSLSYNSIQIKFRFLGYLIWVFLLFIFISSLTTSFIRISLLIQLTPYRMASVFVPIIFIYIYSYSLLILKKKIPLKTSNNYFILKLSIIFITITFLSIRLPQIYKESKILPSTKMKETVDWIKNHTDKDALFINYSDIDIRTYAYRSDFFSFKTIPLYPSAQRKWYDRLLRYYDVDNKINPTEYQRIREYIINPNISLRRVIENIDMKIDYLLLSKDKNITIDFDYILIYENNSYEIYKRKLLSI